MNKNSSRTNENASERKRPPKDWEGVADRQIREAIERGEFDNLPGKGKPLDLGDDPYTPVDLQLAHKILKDAGASLDWIERDKEIRREERALAEILTYEVRWQQQQRASARNLAPDKMISAYELLAKRREMACDRYRERASEINRAIVKLNLEVPVSRLQRRRLEIDDEIDKFISACSE